MIPDIIAWAESPHGFYLDTKKPIKLAKHQKDILRHIFTPDANGRLPYSTILYSCPKKSGKTTVGALIALYMALFYDGEVFTAANDQEQSVGRSFSDIQTAIKHNPTLKPRTKINSKSITLDNGQSITALANDFAGAAGSRHSLALFDELWAYTSEGSRRMYDELTPVPTLQNSLRVIVSYAGFPNESQLLEGLYNQGKAGQPVPELAHIDNGRGQPACTQNGRLFCYWDHELKPYPGLSISPHEYHKEQADSLRPGAYARLHLNDWASAVDRFVPGEAWSACFTPTAHVPYGKMILGADASTARDSTALVGCMRGEDGLIYVVYCRVWTPVKKRKGSLRHNKPTVDLSQTIAAEIRALHDAGRVASVSYDPYQLHSLALDLERAGVKMIEFPQGNQRLKADQALYDAIINGKLRHANDTTLNEHIGAAVAVETSKGIRLAKEKTSMKIDAAVALSMAHYQAAITHHYQPLGLPTPTPSKWHIE